MCTEGTPLVIIRKVSNQGGFEACRRLSYQCDPHYIGSILSRLMKALEYDVGGEADFLDSVAEIEILFEGR